MEGDSVTLNTDLTEIPEYNVILWKFGAGSSPIAEISREKQIFFTNDDCGRFRDRLKLHHQTGSLTITNITSEHAGLYKLEITGAKWKQFIVQHHLSLPLEVEYQDKNNYRCVINNPINNQTRQLDINKLCHTCAGVFGESVPVSVMEGDSVTLNTDLTEIPEYNVILWKFGAGSSPIAEISREKQIFFTYDDGGRFRDRLKLHHQTGSLTITNITSEHAGLYKLEITGATWSSKIFSVSVYARLPVPNIIRDCSSSSLQQNCSLLCSVVNVSRATLSWYKGNSLLSSISVSDLSISLSLPLEVEYQDKNTYSCVINNPISNQTRQLDINKLCTCAVFVSAPAGSLLIVAAFGIFLICRKHRKTDEEGKS
ncbi:hypothetical protein M9458_055249 [Cirrhinus mrigala]|uniref:Ig-like domain-containing protein n=1 Tax=Cirrhinus mrigala TaxID=683832 RepID=A0ABD0MLR6_CIRMR